MTVVMGIIAVLMLLGVSALTSARDQYILDNAVEEAITAVREAQNRSISFTQIPGEGSIKVWGTSFKSDDPKISIIAVNASSAEIPFSQPEINSNITISPSQIYVYFASPFGTPYVMSAPCESWSESTINPSKEYVPARTATTVDTTITFSYKDKTAQIIISKGGDIRAN
jgi:type II secretory pathway pseudopilin PulG